MGNKSKKLPEKSKKSDSQPYWLPIDYRLIPPIFKFSHVKGIAKIFLLIEISLSLLVVIGTLFIVFWTVIAG